MKAYINGEEQEITHKGGYLYIERIWENADKVTLDFKIETKVVKLNNSQAIVRGPLLFARDSRFNDGDTITVEPWRSAGFPVIKDLMVAQQSRCNTSEN